VNFSYYRAFIWLPTLLVASGMNLGRSFGFTLVITLAQLPGYCVAAVLVEQWLPTANAFAVPGRFGRLAAAFTWGRPERRGEPLEDRLICG
jgi:putative MFS transporter